LTALNNLALKQLVTTSSTKSGRRSSTIVDGIIEESENVKFSTKNEEKPWVKIDLHGPFNVKLVKIFASSGAAWNSMTPLLVLAENEERHSHLCQHVKSFEGGKQLVVKCEGSFFGRFVVIKSLKKTALTLNEVQVFAD